MRNEFPSTCARCENGLEAGEGIVYTRFRRRPFPVLCDSCMYEVDDEEHEAAQEARELADDD